MCNVLASHQYQILILPENTQFGSIDAWLLLSSPSDVDSRYVAFCVRCFSMCSRSTFIVAMLDAVASRLSVASHFSFETEYHCWLWMWLPRPEFTLHGLLISSHEPRLACYEQLPIFLPLPIMKSTRVVTNQESCVESRKRWPLSKTYGCFCLVYFILECVQICSSEKLPMRILLTSFLSISTGIIFLHAS